MKHVFQSSHAAYIQRAVDISISLYRGVMLHGYITLQIRSTGHIQRTAELAICSGHVAISYHVSMRNHVTVRNDVATGNDIGITGNISGRSNLPICMKIGIDRSLTIYNQSAINLLIPFRFTVTINRGIPFDFRRSFHCLISFHRRRAISCGITTEIRITCYSEEISGCTACNI